MEAEADIYEVHLNVHDHDQGSSKLHFMRPGALTYDLVLSRHFIKRALARGTNYFRLPRNSVETIAKVPHVPEQTLVT